MVRKRKQLVLYCLLIFASLAGMTVLTGCGATPPHTAMYTVTITGTSGSQVQTTVKLTLH